MNKNSLPVIVIVAALSILMGFLLGVKYQTERTPRTPLPYESVGGVWREIPKDRQQANPAANTAVQPQTPTLNTVPLQDPATGRVRRVAGINAPIDAQHPQGTVYPD